MSMNPGTKSTSEPLDLSRWRNVPMILMIAGALLGGIGLIASPKQFLFALFCFGVWFLWPNRLRYWSLKQDTQNSDSSAMKPGFFRRLIGMNQESPGIVECTRQMRKFSGIGIFLFALTLTIAAVMWMK